jgi:hypothetical protein
MSRLAMNLAVTALGSRPPPLRSHDFDGHDPPQSRIARTIDFPHPAAARQRLDQLRTQASSGTFAALVVIWAGRWFARLIASMPSASSLAL